jgi:hypothetical protein
MAALGMCGTVFGVDGQREGRRGGVGDGFHGGSLVQWARRVDWTSMGFEFYC